MSSQYKTWGELFHAMNSGGQKRDWFLYRYFFSPTLDSNNGHGDGYNRSSTKENTKVYKNLIAATSHEYVRAIDTLDNETGQKMDIIGNVNGRTSLDAIKQILDHSIEQEVAFYKMLEKKSGMDFGDFIVKTKEITNVFGGSEPNYRNLVQPLNDKMRSMFSTQGNNQALDFYNMLGSRELYDFLSSKYENIISRGALANTIFGKNHTKSGDEVESFGDEFFMSAFTKGNGKSRELNYSSVLGKILKVFFGKSNSLKQQVVVTNGKDAKVALKKIIASVATDKEEQTFKIGVKGQKKKQEVRLSVKEGTFKMTGANGQVIMSITSDTLTQNDTSLKKINGYAGIEFFREFVKMLQKAIDETDSQLHTNVGDWFRVNGEDFLMKGLNLKSDLQKLDKKAQKYLKELNSPNANESDLKKKYDNYFNAIQKISTLRSFTNADISGLLGELQATALRYAGLGNTTLEGHTIEDGAQAHYDVKLELNNQKYGIQVKHYVSSDNVPIYADGTEFSFAKTTTLKKYFGEELATAFQYLIVNNSTYNAFNFETGAELVSDIDVEQDIRNLIPTYLTNFLRLTSGSSRISNIFYILNGVLVPSSVIVAMLYTLIADSIMGLNSSKAGLFDISIKMKENVNDDIWNPKEIQNIVNSNYLKQSKIKFTGFRVKASNLYP